MNLSTPLDYPLTNAGWKVGWFTADKMKLERLSSFFTTLCILFGCLFQFNSAIAQPPPGCGNIQCTSNDVRVIRAYLSGPNDAAIDCSSPNPFQNAELHLIVSSNTKRIGVSISTTLLADKSYPLGNCFSETLNNGSNNNLKFDLGDALLNVQCETSFSLTNVFTSWGTGNTNFCNSSDPQCPATPAKCRFKDGEIIKVDVKLDVDFTFKVGDCSKGENGLKVDFTPSVTAQNITYPLTFDWDFGDGSGHATTTEADANEVATAGTSYTYASDGTYTVTLTVTDASSTPVVKSTHYQVTVATCCTLLAPTVTAGPFCSADNKTVGNLPQSDGSGGTYHWYDGPDPATSFELDPTTVLVNGATYYVSVSVGDCESGRTAVTITVNSPVTPQFTQIQPICNGGTILLPTTSDNGIAGSWSPAVDNTQTTAYTFTPTAGQCATNATMSVTVNPLPTASISGSTAICLNATAPSVTFTGANGTAPYTFTYTINGGSSQTVSTTSGNSVTVSQATGTAGSFVYTLVSVKDASTTACSQAQTGTATITVNPLPTCTITRTDGASSTTSSVGATASFSGPLPFGTTYTYSWSFTSNTSGASFVGGVNNIQAVSVKTTTVGSYTLSLTVTDNTTNCSSSPSCNYTVTINPVGPSITYTQGFYGNSGGKTCNTLYSYQVMNSAVSAAGGSIRFGNSTDSRSFTLMQSDVNNTTKSNIYQMLPGGTTPSILKFASSYSSTATTALFSNRATWPAVPMSPGINNVLLAQTMALRFNIYYSSSVSKPIGGIGGLVLTGNVLTFVKPTTSCGSTYPTTGGTTQTIPCTVYNYLTGMNGGATIGNLLTLANKVLGGEVPTTTVSPSDISNAVDIINKGFDGGGQIIKVGTSCTTTAPAITQSSSTTITEAVAIHTNLTVSAFPNPYTDKVKFVIQSPVSGQATLDVFNMLGQKIKTVFQGNVVAGIGQLVEYNVPKVNAGNLMYILRVGNNKVTGKLIH